MLHSRTVACWKRHKLLLMPLFGNGFSTITSLFFVVDRKDQQTVSCRLCTGYQKGTLRTWKMLFLIWLHPCYIILECFTIAPILTSTLTVFRWNHGDPSSLYRTYFRACYKYYRKHNSFWFGLELPMHRSWSKLANKCIPYNWCVQNFMQIGWDLAVWGSKTCFWVETEPGQAYA